MSSQGIKAICELLDMGLEDYWEFKTSRPGTNRFYFRGHKPVLASYKKVGFHLTQLISSLFILLLSRFFY
uniref:Uncharacterized protein n=1 Tax=Helianthus annuus TaxID=4232 RepID=A0A251TVX6_HELAN